MEKKFYSEDLEDLLKESADDFKMQPSKKVWHGIYNDLHPGTRWPSIAMSLIFIFALVIVGHLNTQQSQHAYITKLKNGIHIQNNITRLNENNSNTTALIKNRSQKNKKQIAIRNNVTSQNPSNQKDGTKDQSLTQADNSFTDLPAGAGNDKSSEHNTTISLHNNNNTNSINSTNSQLADINESSKIGTLKTTEVVAVNKTSFSNPDGVNSILKSNGVEEKIAKAYDKKSILSLSNSLAKNENAHIRILKQRRSPKTNLTFYISPSISYRTYSKPHYKGMQTGTSNFTNADMNRSVVQSVAPGFEVGTAIKYVLSKKLKFTTGLQVNYSAYRIQANNIHPKNATLLLYNNKTNLPYLISTISYFGNGPGIASVNLHNYSLQLSLPVGFDYVLAKNDKLQLIASTSFQPSLIISNRAYILSTDKVNYITQAALLRRWNMGTNFGTYISFNSNKFNWQIGPQVHYQFLSSYNNDYRVAEHFIDYGIRFGISRVIK